MARMSRLLNEALPLDEPGRRVWLEALPADHQDIAAVLRDALLPSSAEIEEALATLPKVGSDDEPDSVASGLEPGARVGPYKLLKRLGTGGMAEVWLARRADGAFKREVALKLPMLTRLRKDLEQRFARERDILASLEHPNIARLYDAGLGAEGLPYLAMEYVPGQPLTAWCDAHRLGILERLKLLLQVLAAVQYAHERNVIHRDLKPSNILVSEAGAVRLLDFGVAKLLQTDEADRTQLTSIYGRALTPDYASPELMRGDVVDARSDIYSVGVLLYELLTGARPYHLKAGASAGMLEQAIATLEVGRPSTRLTEDAHAARATTHERLARLLRGDLDVIALKALAKDPEERYTSASSMAEDLQHHLHSEAIRAQPPRLSYRIHKFVHRHGTGVTVTATVTAIIFAMVGYEIHRIATDQAREIAALPAATPLGDKSIAVLPFVDMSEKKDQEYFSDGMSEELIDMLTRVPDLRVPARTSSFYFKGKQATIAEIARALGVAHVLEGSVRKSGNTLRVTAQLIRVDKGYHMWSQTYDRTLDDVFKMQDEIAGAVVTALKLKLAPLQTSSSLQTTNTEAFNQYLLGRQFYDRRNVDGWRLAVAAYRKAIALDPNLAAAYANLAFAEAYLADFTSDPLAANRQALTDAEKAVALAPDEGEGYVARGYFRSVQNWDWSGAEADFEKALALHSGDSTVRYGWLQATLGHLSKAIAAEKVATELDPLSHVSWQHLGRYLSADRQFSAAHEAIRRSLEIQPESSFSLKDLGTLQLLEGNAAGALASFRKIGLENFRLTSIAMAEHTLGHARESQQALDEAVAKHARDATYQIADVYAWRGEKAKAFEWLERAYALRDGGLSSIKFDLLLSSLRGDPRYRALVRKMKLPE